MTDLPLDRIQQSLQLTGDQLKSLDALKAASAQASDALTASCSGEVPMTPLGRLDMAQKRIDGMVQAWGTMRTPLDDFYNSLNGRTVPVTVGHCRTAVCLYSLLHHPVANGSPVAFLPQENARTLLRHVDLHGGCDGLPVLNFAVEPGFRIGQQLVRHDIEVLLVELFDRLG